MLGAGGGGEGSARVKVSGEGNSGCTPMIARVPPTPPPAFVGGKEWVGPAQNAWRGMWVMGKGTTRPPRLVF